MDPEVKNLSTQGTTCIPVLVPGIDFDQDGRKTPLQELRQMEGVFPLSKVADRMPFRRKQLYRWAWKGPFVSCFEHARSENGGKSTRIRVNLSLLSERFDALAR